MDISAQKRLELMEEIIADAGGIENIDLHTELSKKITALRRQNMANKTASPVTAQSIMGNNPVLTANPPVTAPISPSVAQQPVQTGQAPIEPQNGLNEQMNQNTPPGM